VTTPAIRRATADDVDTLVRLGRLTFTQTFAHLYPAEDLAEFLATAHAPEVIAADLADPQSAAWLVEQDGEAIGYATAGVCGLPHPDVTAQCGELKRIYLLQGRQGGGAGSRLLQTVFEWLEHDGPRTLWIGVWSENHGAQRLYGRHGFVKAGEYEFVVGNTRDREFILRRSAAEAA
jgi:ribosomal protein S18 acetylase RimI-like enzyme